MYFHQSKLFIRLAIWLASIFASFLTGFIFFYIGVQVAGYIYELEYPIPPGEDDLGAGFMMIADATIILVIAIILSLFLIKFFKKIFSQLFRSSS